MCNKHKAEPFVGRETFHCQLQLLTGPTLSDVADQLLIPANDILQEMHLRLRNFQDTDHLIGMKVHSAGCPEMQKQVFQNHVHCRNSCCKMYSSSSAESLTL